MEKKNAQIVYLNPSNEKKPVCTQGTGCGIWECYDERSIADKVAEILYSNGYAVIVKEGESVPQNKEEVDPDGVPF